MSKEQIFAVSVGVVCHLSFVAAVSLMMFTIYTGLLYSPYKSSDPSSFFVNALLILQFPILHSFALSSSGGKILAHLSPRLIGRQMQTTWFAVLASWQLIASFLLWHGSGIVIFEFTGLFRVVSTLLYASSWLFLLKTMFDADITLQTGFKGWVAVLRKETPKYKCFSQSGTFSLCRQPIYLAFLLILWTAPVWTIDRLALSLVWGLYCFFGPRLKEARFLRLFGEEFEEYRRRVPYFFPRTRPIGKKVEL